MTRAVVRATAEGAVVPSPTVVAFANTVRARTMVVASVGANSHGAVWPRPAIIAVALTILSAYTTRITARWTWLRDEIELICIVGINFNELN